jgi:hypothetical protein
MTTPADGTCASIKTPTCPDHSSIDRPWPLASIKAWNLVLAISIAVLAMRVRRLTGPHGHYRCPHCRMRVHAQATKCPHCHTEFDPSPSPQALGR